MAVSMETGMVMFLLDLFDYDPFEATDVDGDGVGDNGDVCLMFMEK